jgi:hypothetical protein
LVRGLTVVARHVDDSEPFGVLFAQRIHRPDKYAKSA